MAFREFQDDQFDSDPELVAPVPDVIAADTTCIIEEDEPDPPAEPVEIPATVGATAIRTVSGFDDHLAQQEGPHSESSVWGGALDGNDERLSTWNGGSITDMPGDGAPVSGSCDLPVATAESIEPVAEQGIESVESNEPQTTLNRELGALHAIGNEAARRMTEQNVHELPLQTENIPPQVQEIFDAVPLTGRDDTVVGYSLRVKLVGGLGTDWPDAQDTTVSRRVTVEYVRKEEGLVSSQGDTTEMAVRYIVDDHDQDWAKTMHTSDNQLDRYEGGRALSHTYSGLPGPQYQRSLTWPATIEPDAVYREGTQLAPTEVRAVAASITQFSETIQQPTDIIPVPSDHDIAQFHGAIRDAIAEANHGAVIEFSFENSVIREQSVPITALPTFVQELFDTIPLRDQSTVTHFTRLATSGRGNNDSDERADAIFVRQEHLPDGRIREVGVGYDTRILRSTWGGAPEYRVSRYATLGEGPPSDTTSIQFDPPTSARVIQRGPLAARRITPTELRELSESIRRIPGQPELEG